MIRYTTPQLLLTVPADLSGADVYVSMEQGKTERDIKATSVTVEDGKTTIVVTLSQEDTAAFKATSVKMQINWITEDGKRYATRQKTVKMNANLLEEVITYGD